MDAAGSAAKLEAGIELDGTETILTDLLIAAGADTCITNMYGEVPAFHACPNLATITQQGSDVRNNKGQTVLHAA